MAFEFITQAPRWQKILLGVVPLAAIGFLGYYFLLSPTMEEVTRLKAEKAALEGKVLQGRAETRNLAGYEAKAKELEARLISARERLPADKEIPKLYRQISDLATQQGLTVSVFQPKPIQVRDYYAEVPLLLAGDTGYHELGDFFGKLARLPRIVTLSDFKLQGISGPTGGIRVELNMVTYLLRPEGGPPAGAKR